MCKFLRMSNYSQFMEPDRQVFESLLLYMQSEENYLGSFKMFPQLLNKNNIYLTGWIK